MTIFFELKFNKKYNIEFFGSYSNYLSKLKTNFACKVAYTVVIKFLFKYLIFIF